MATLPNPARPVSLPAPSASDRWRADHERFKLARKRIVIRTSMRVVMGSMAMFGMACVMLALMMIRLHDLCGITWDPHVMIDVIGVASCVGMPIAFMAMSMALAWEACERMARLIENP